MKLIYTNENRFLVNNVKNIVENAGIEVTLKNEFSGGAAGELVVFETWLELWVVDDADYDEAMGLIEALNSSEKGHDWVCSQCGETNDASFEICWKCQSESGAIW